MILDKKGKHILLFSLVAITCILNADNQGNDNKILDIENSKSDDKNKNSEEEFSSPCILNADNEGNDNKTLDTENLKSDDKNKNSEEKFSNNYILNPDNEDNDNKTLDIENLKSDDKNKNSEEEFSNKKELEVDRDNKAIYNANPTDNDVQIRDLEYRLNVLEYSSRGCLANPSARPTQKCDFGGYITIDPLLLKAQEEGLEFILVTQNAGQQTFSPAGNVTPFLAGRTKAKTLHFDWGWGFRIGLGANLNHDGWDVNLQWMRFRTDTHRHLKTDGIKELFTPVFAANQVDIDPVSPTLAPQGMLKEAKSDWRLHFNELDLELGRQFFVSKWLTIKPRAGLRTAWIKQSDKIAYENWLPPVFSGTAFRSVVDYFVNMKCKYWGLGLIGGLDTQWGLGCNWSLFANFDASILYGYFATSNRQTSLQQTGVFFNLFEFQDFFHVSRFITDFFAGIRYDYMFCDERYHLGVQVGWEYHLFFGQNQFVKFPSDVSLPGVIVSSQNDLSLQGVSAQVRFDF